MSNIKTLKGRVINKHKTEEQWYLDVYKAAGGTELRDDPFIPLNGELIIYDPDSVYTERRIKIGDGSHNVVTLPFYQGNPADLLTENKTLVGAINELNGKTLDKVTYYNFDYGNIDNIQNDSYGIYYQMDTAEAEMEGPDGGCYYGYFQTSNRIPIAAGENVTFTVDEDNQVVRINDVSVSQGLEYILVKNKNHYGVSGIGTCADTKIVIPAYYNGLPVKGIASYAFENCTTIESVVIPETVREINNGAFRNCTSLENIIIPRSVETISDYAFQSCYTLKSINIPKSVNHMGEIVFAGCNSLTICCENDSYITGYWHENWNPDNLPVFYNCDINSFAAVNVALNSKASADSVGSLKETLKNKANKSEILKPQISTTYFKLKSLRDDGRLIPGAFYRITDYLCTTSQENTRAMQNKFDIIVQALSNKTLSETASADYHYVTNESDELLLKPNVIDEDGVLKEGAITPIYYLYEDRSESGNTRLGTYKEEDGFIAYSYSENDEGIVVPVIYKTDIASAIDSPDEFGDPDYADEFYYVGTEILDGIIYDKWRKINEEVGPYWDGSDGYIYLYTNLVVGSETHIEGIQPEEANLSAWELKYCLDNDTTRFAWADDNVTLTLTLEGDEFGGQYIREPSLDNPTFLSGSGRSAWLYAQNQLGDDEILVIYTTASSEKYGICEWARFQLQEGEYVCIACDQTQIDFYFGETAGAGRGVIYYMKDEHNNECPYDFKNIQFKRYMITEIEVESISDLVGHYWGITDGYNYTVDESDYIWCYTFSWLNENDEVEDLSIVGQKLTNDEGKCSGVYSNVINTISACPDNPEQYGIALNNIVCLSEWGYEEGLFYGCYSNTFGNDCQSNTFGDSCYSNTFGNDCNYNTFGNDCYSNTFGNDCSSNTFSNNCHSNTFDNYCYSNTFGDSCYSNTFGNYCSNTFGKDCHENAFDNGCYENTFGDYCNLITFGNNCSYNTFGADTELVTYAKLVHFVDGCQHIKLICSKAGDDENYLQDIVVSAGVRGTADKPRELQVSRNAPPVVFEAANTTHIILDD